MACGNPSLASAVVRRSVLALLALVACGPVLAQPRPLGTAFTYQGRLNEGGGPAAGTYDFQFRLFDAAAGGSQIGGALDRGDVAVADGLFTVLLDFGANAFSGDARWLEIGVRRGNSSGAYTLLSGRQELTPVPNALYSQTTRWSGVAGKPAGFADDTDNDALGSLSCGAGELAKWTGSAWGCAADLSSGGVTSIAAGPGLRGGTITSSGTLSVDFAGTGGASSAARSDHSHGDAYQARITGSCSAGSAVRRVNADGTVLCEPTAARTSAACCSSTSSGCPGCVAVCGSGRVVAEVGGVCTVTSDTGTCTNHSLAGRCCVCRP